jgi:hypothetical protein
MANPIDYHFSLTLYDVNDGVTIPYFVAHKFNTAQLIVPDTGIYQNEINKIKAMGVPNVIVDIEQPIWAGGNNKDIPIANFANYFQQLKSVGVKQVSTEGGRDGDFDFIGKYFGLVNYNCDQCGLWKGNYKHPATVMNSWESYYTWEWPSIQQGVKESAPLGKKNGILAGVWGGSENPILANTNAGSGFSFYDEAAWIDANGGLDHYGAWGGLNNYMLGRYKALGFEQIVSKLQSIYPPRGTTPPVMSVTFKDIATTADCIDRFARGSDGALWHTHFANGSWMAWESFGGILTSAPAAVSRMGGLIDVFVRGVTGALWHKQYIGGKWQDWENLKGIIKDGTSPTACSRAVNIVDVLVIGMDANYRKTMTDGVWSGWIKEDKTIRG